jgi:hypothetical protein
VNGKQRCDSNRERFSGFACMASYWEIRWTGIL